jgi:hypothetical protein
MNKQPIVNNLDDLTLFKVLKINDVTLFVIFLL